MWVIEQEVCVPIIFLRAYRGAEFRVKKLKNNIKMYIKEIWPG